MVNCSEEFLTQGMFLLSHLCLRPNLLCHEEFDKAEINLRGVPDENATALYARQDSPVAAVWLELLRDLPLVRAFTFTLLALLAVLICTFCAVLLCPGMPPAPGAVFHRDTCSASAVHRITPSHL